ncbi:hypothetical protein ColTof4_14332 [Colletotrichum tofieldiae]|nr:hypothetical protein ColTof3_14743 [Colletotrichum tofieldiae]GKT81909.1 hypothetical protein ColTof4_14332 [Colletotrichum tofieldiae]
MCDLWVLLDAWDELWTEMVARVQWKDETCPYLGQVGHGLPWCVLRQSLRDQSDVQPKDDARAQVRRHEDLYARDVIAGPREARDRPNVYTQDVQAVKAKRISRLSCSTSLTELTEAAYQMGIDRHKCGSKKTKIPRSAPSWAHELKPNIQVHTKLPSMLSMSSSLQRVGRSYGVVNLVRIDPLGLSPAERIAVSYNIAHIMKGGSVPIDLLENLKLD